MIPQYLPAFRTKAVSRFMLFCLLSLFACKKDGAAPSPTPITNLFTGTYKGKINASASNAQGGYNLTIDNATVTITPGASANEVTWNIGLPTGTTDACKATTSGTTLTIPRQTVNDISGKSAVYQGTGALAGNQLTLTIDYQLDSAPAGTYTYVITASR